MGKVINFSEARRKKAKEKNNINDKTLTKVKDDVKEIFDEIIKRNQKNLERVREKRKKNNKSTLRSYQIKHSSVYPRR